VNIVRGPRRRGYVIIPNRAVEDSRLSWKARGLLAYLLSRPDGWHTDSVRLADVGPDGRDAIRSGLTELERAGYLRRIRTQVDRGQWVTHCEITDDPGTLVPRTDYPASDEPTSENPNVGEPGAKELSTTENNKRPSSPHGEPDGCAAHGSRHPGCPECMRTPVGLHKVKPGDYAGHASTVRAALKRKGRP